MSEGRGVVTNAIGTGKLFEYFTAVMQGKPRGEQVLLLCAQADLLLIDMICITQAIEAGVSLAREVARLELERQQELLKASRVYGGKLPMDLSQWSYFAMKELYGDGWAWHWDHAVQLGLYEAPKILAVEWERQNELH